MSGYGGGGYGGYGGYGSYTGNGGSYGGGDAYGGYDAGGYEVGMAASIDTSFISQHEGGQHLTAYTVDPLRWPKAGVTVATGVDLGHTDATQLANWGLSEAQISQLQPYLGLTGSAAQSYLNSNPLTIGTDMANLLDTGALDEIAGSVGQAFDAADSSATFNSLPQAAQTAIVDLAYQYGANLASATPKFWNDITTNSWESAVDELYNFGDKNPTRRADEGALIQGAINSGALPSN